ncbi:FIST C-terminal domain-containing protein [Gammaproteobacteria bacterium]|nr:FIST C-terminal domain-containing protein [Gammaproteobacteria bacterium]
MKVSIGIGISNKVGGYDAGLEAASTAQESLGADAPDLVFVFSTIGYDQDDILDAVAERFGDVPVSGATFEGVIGRGVADESMYAVQIVGLKSDEVRFHSFQAANAVENPMEAGEELGRQVAGVTQGGNRVLFLFPDFRTNITSLFGGIEKHCNLPFIGGPSCDNLKFQYAYQSHKGVVTEHACNAVLMVGDFDFKTIVTHGSEPLGGPRTVTKCDGNVIYEIDGRPALDVASEGFGEAITLDNMAHAIMLMGIGFKTEASSNFLSPYVVRAIFEFNFEDKSCTIPTVVSEGSEIQFMRRDPHSILNSSRLAAQKLGKIFDSLTPAPTPALICQFDCAGRGKVIVGDDVLTGVTDLQAEFAATVPWMGSFCFGEISPIDGKNHFHNYTATLAVFY